MTKRNGLKREAYFLTKDLESENMKLRFRIEQLQEQIKKERRERYLVEDELACIRQEQRNAAQRWNGVGR